MSKFNVSTPSGFPEFNPAQERVRHQWIDTIRDTFEAYGFGPIYTPLVEREENLLGKGGNPKEMYVLKRLHDEEGDTSHSGNALRFDHTVPLALYVARHQNDIAFPFKRYAIGPVFRGERAQKGRYRQFDQCDIDVIGSGSLAIENDALMPAVIIDIFRKLMPEEPFQVRINNRKVLLGFFQSLNVAQEDLKQALDIVDDLEKIGQEKTRLSLKEKLGFDEAQAKTLCNFMELEVTDVSQGLALKVDNALFQEGLTELVALQKALEALNVPREYYRFDFRIARGLDYYTGTVYETNLTHYSGLGSICSGGRYEDLASVFTNKAMPGVGISIGLTRLMGQLFDADIIQPDPSGGLEMLFVPADETAIHTCLSLASDLRAKGKSVEVYLEKKKLAKKFDYANKLGVSLVAVIGENEMADQKVGVKNMETGEQQEVSFDDLDGLLSS